VVWGTGKAQREFLHVDDMADACVFLMERYDGSEIVNIGCGEDVSIGELARMVAEVVGYEGRIVQDTSKPDGTPRKLLDVGRLRGLGWQARIRLGEGLKGTYAWYVQRMAKEAATFAVATPAAMSGAPRAPAALSPDAIQVTR
jgi:GDP-L-fucose synthase